MMDAPVLGIDREDCFCELFLRARKSELGVVRRFIRMYMMKKRRREAPSLVRSIGAGCDAGSGGLGCAQLRSRCNRARLCIVRTAIPPTNKPRLHGNRYGQMNTRTGVYCVAGASTLRRYFE